MSGYKIEICANSAGSALEAQKGGAYRVELCTALPEGGLTPSFGEIATCRKLLTQAKLHVLVRPRGGDFLYGGTEQEIMLQDIEIACRLGVDGFVFGCLTTRGNIDMGLMEKLMQATQGKPVTFHRAFDMCRHPVQALEDIISLGCKYILTSGQQDTAEKGIPLLKQLVEQAKGRITIMPGSGINPHNIAKIARETGAREFHFSARTSSESQMAYRNPYVSMGGTVRIDEYSIQKTSASLVREALEALQSS